MKKLSKAQIRLLQQMYKYDASVCVLRSGLSTSTFLLSFYLNVSGLHYKTIYNLANADFLVITIEEGYSSTYALTEKAIEFLKEDRNDVA